MPVLRELRRQHVSRRGVRTNLVVVLFPLSQFVAGVLQCQEKFGIEIFIPESPVEALDSSIFDWLAGSDKVELEAIAVDPGVHF